MPHAPWRLLYELVRSHGESGLTAQLLRFTVDGLIWAASMVVLDASRRNQPVHGWPPGTWARHRGPRSAQAWLTASVTVRSVP